MDEKPGSKISALATFLRPFLPKAAIKKIQEIKDLDQQAKQWVKAAATIGVSVPAYIYESGKKNLLEQGDKLIEAFQNTGRKRKHFDDMWDYNKNRNLHERKRAHYLNNKWPSKHDWKQQSPNPNYKPTEAPKPTPTPAVQKPADPAPDARTPQERLQEKKKKDEELKGGKTGVSVPGIGGNKPSPSPTPSPGKFILKYEC